MLEELQQIDTSAIEALCKIKEEEEVLQGRLDKMDEKKGQVSGEVFERVRQDYAGRVKALEDSAKPLKKQARQEYAKLAELNKRLGANLQAAKLAKEELEFRNELGEFAGEDFKQQLKECEQRVEQCETEVADGEKLKQSFVAAFHSEDELQAPVEPPPAKPESKPAAEAQRKSEAKEEKPSAKVAEAPKPTPPPPPVVEPPSKPAAEKPAPRQPDAGRESKVALPTPAAPQRVADADAGDATAILSRPRLVSQAADGRQEEFPLSFVSTSIGRSPENDVCIADDSVSRRHAKIVMNEKGFSIVDLKSENGVFVNGERVAQRLLATGDVIEMGPGTKRFTFYGP